MDFEKGTFDLVVNDELRGSVLGGKKIPKDNTQYRFGFSAYIRNTKVRMLIYDGKSIKDHDLIQRKHTNKKI